MGGFWWEKGMVERVRKSAQQTKIAGSTSLRCLGDRHWKEENSARIVEKPARQRQVRLSPMVCGTATLPGNRRKLGTL